MEKILLTEEELINFKQWLELNLESISWEGRYIEEFNSFWDELFLVGKEVDFHISRILYAREKATSGPLITWFNWLYEKFLCYLFLYKDVSLRELGKLGGLSERKVSLILRDFFIERYPHLEDSLNDNFQVGTIVSSNLYLKFSDLKKTFGLNSGFRGSLEDEILTSLEITLYPDWQNIFQLLKKMNKEHGVKLDSLVKKATFKRQVKFFQELALLFIIGGLVIFSIKVGNKYYEDYLVKKISLFEPNFFWLDKSLTFKSKDPLAGKEVELSYKELEKLEKLESQKVFEDNLSTKRFDVESDVVLTSVDALPKDFKVAGLEQSDYEEVRKGGYRDSRYGRRKAYRVMMTSVNPKLTKNKLIDVLKYFDVKQVDNVKPGTNIPGGLYFNLYVPRKKLKEFLSRVSSVEESTILESKTVFGGPYGTNKVFIWIKGI
ncbi:MAG: hypothetical protein KC478_01930 [Bacteriovoracaceae bacterium]|nr:hypothetical protein [Bacteriovoracaceae bacterium]